MSDSNKPIVYSCSGCSNLAQLAYDIALQLESDGIAEMSCISGVVGNVEPIKQMAESGRPIIIIDGCSLACTRACLEACGLKAVLYIDISRYGIEKRSIRESAFNESCVALKHVYEELRMAGYAIPH
ncbi:putative zinc-binding protein [Aliikangiella maris]|uniref:Zinc-binding protein n=2 Tax=Aliikangiella maris TaxID=3162458 RepID=A0ABV2BRD4_9GAMM